MHAVVMAAGEGRRLRPLTERYAKPVLPIDGRPVLVTLVRELAEAGLGPITVVVGRLAAQVEALLQGLPLDLRLVRQPRPDGSADAVRRALAAGVETPLVAVAADTVFAPGDLGAFARAFAGSSPDGMLAARRDPPPGPGRPALRVREGRVERVLDDDPCNPVSSGPLWALGPRVAELLADLPGPPFELAAAFQRAVDAGLAILGREIGPTLDLTFPADLIERNFPYLAAAREPHGEAGEGSASSL